MKIAIQAGHKNMTSGATGATGERAWTDKTTALVSQFLKLAGQEVVLCDAFANVDSKITGTDWDLFLAVHYDADIYNDRGGFTDFPSPEVDDSNARSKELSEKIGKYFFEKTGIPYKSRSNANTKYYYMWESLSSKTPCVIIECGIGNRKPEDFNTLQTNIDTTAKTLAQAILYSLDLPLDISSMSAIGIAEIQKLETEVSELRLSRNDWRTKAKQYMKELESKNALIDSLTLDLDKSKSTITTLQNAIQTNKTPLSAYGKWERFVSIFESILNA